MSEMLGILACPQCDSTIFHLQDWSAYVSVTCQYCGHKMGELKEEDDG